MRDTVGLCLHPIHAHRKGSSKCLLMHTIGMNGWINEWMNEWWGWKEKQTKSFLLSMFFWKMRDGHDWWEIILSIYSFFTGSSQERGRSWLGLGAKRTKIWLCPYFHIPFNDKMEKLKALEVNWRSNAQSISYWLCDLEQVTWPLWAIFLIHEKGKFTDAPPGVDKIRCT